MPPFQRARTSDIALHTRRVRRMLLQGSVITAALGLFWGVIFALLHSWLVVTLDGCCVALSIVSVALVHRCRLRLASYLYIGVVYAIVCTTALLMDVPTALVPRSMHTLLLPLAACACLLLREEPPLLRHGIPLTCVLTFVGLGATSLHVVSAYGLSDSIRYASMWSALVASAVTLHLTVLVILADVADRNALEGELRNALIRGELLLHYQPQMDMHGRLIGAEALVRWRHPLRGLVPPNDFIPLAEATGLMIPIGDWVMRSACVQLAHWQANPATANVTLAVNVSASQFAEANFVERVLENAREASAQISLLKLELTESILADDIDDVVRKMTALKLHGLRFSLDDFGTGFSSLNYLRQLPLDQLKIDQSFVRNMLRSSKDASIAQTVVTLGQSLGLDVIAEGVETSEHRRALAAMGCRSFQGYFFARPLAASDFETFANDVMARPVLFSPIGVKGDRDF